MLKVLGMTVDRYAGVLPWRIPAIAPARNRSVRSSSRRWERTRSSWASVRGWNATLTSSGTGSVRASGPSPLPAAGTNADGWPGRATTRSARSSQWPASPAQTSRSAASRRARLGRGRRLELGGGQHVGERVEVVADADPALGRRLDGRGAAAGERVEHDVARAGCSAR